MPVPIEKAVEVARAAVKAACPVLLNYYEKGFKIETKPDASLVTEADRAAEKTIIETILGAFPGHSVLGEETGPREGDPSYRWVVDPLDGTHGFTRGGSFWGPLVALQAHGEVMAGAMALPVFERTYWAGRGTGAFRDGTRLQVSSVEELSRATLSLGEIRGLLKEPQAPAILDLIAQAASTRCYGDLASATKILDGRAEIWLEAGVQVWDLAPISLLLEEAGGRYSDFTGGSSIELGHAVGTNGRLHDQVLRLLSEVPQV